MPGLLVADEARTPCTNRCPTPGLLTESTNAVHTTHKLWQIDSFLLGLQWDSRFEWPEYSVGLAFFRLLSSGWRAWLLVFTYKEILQFLSTILVHQLSIRWGGLCQGGPRDMNGDEMRWLQFPFPALNGCLSHTGIVDFSPKSILPPTSRESKHI